MVSFFGSEGDRIASECITFSLDSVGYRVCSLFHFDSLEIHKHGMRGSRKSAMTGTGNAFLIQNIQKPSVDLPGHAFPSTSVSITADVAEWWQP